MLRSFEVRLETDWPTRQRQSNCIWSTLCCIHTTCSLIRGLQLSSAVPLIFRGNFSSGWLNRWQPNPLKWDGLAVAGFPDCVIYILRSSVWLCKWRRGRPTDGGIRCKVEVGGGLCGMCTILSFHWFRFSFRWIGAVLRALLWRQRHKSVHY